MAHSSLQLFALLFIPCVLFGNNITVELYSRGKDQNETHGHCSFIKINGGEDVTVDADTENVHRGHKVVVIDAITGTLLDSVAYDTCRCFPSNPSYITNDNMLVNYLTNVPSNDRIVAIVIYDDANGAINTSDVLRSWGCSAALLSSRDSFIFIGSPDVDIPSWQTCTKHLQYDAAIYGQYVIDLVSMEPTMQPTEPSFAPITPQPSSRPTAAPSSNPTASPSWIPSILPTTNPTRSTSTEPTASPSSFPTKSPSNDPTALSTSVTDPITFTTANRNSGHGKSQQNWSVAKIMQFTGALMVTTIVIWCCIACYCVTQHMKEKKQHNHAILMEQHVKDQMISMHAQNPQQHPAEITVSQNDKNLGFEVESKRDAHVENNNPFSDEGQDESESDSCGSSEELFERIEEPITTETYF